MGTRLRLGTASILSVFSGRIAVGLIALGAAVAACASGPLAAEITAIVAARAADSGSMHREWIERVYATNADAVWFTSSGARSDVAVALRELRSAAKHGLVAAD